MMKKLKFPAAVLTALFLLTGAACAATVSDWDHGLIAFSSSPEYPAIGDLVTLLVRFDDARRPREGSLSLSVTDGGGIPIRTWEESELTAETVTTGGTVEWRTSASITSTRDMRHAAITWRDSNDGTTQSRNIPLNIGSGGNDALTDGGLSSYLVTDRPSRSGDDMETRARFLTMPDRNSVYMVLKKSDSDSGTTYDPEDFDYEGGYYTCDFDFVLTNGIWTSTLHWSVNGKQYSRTLSFRMSGGNFSDEYDSYTADGGLYSYDVSSRPGYSGDIMKTRARFTIRPDSDSLRMVLRRVGYSGTSHIPNNSTIDGGEYVYDFRFPVTYGSWQSTLSWSINGTVYSRTYEFRVDEEYFNDWNGDDWITDLSGCSAGGMGAVALLALLTLLPRRRGRP